MLLLWNGHPARQKRIFYTNRTNIKMKRLVKIHIEKLPEGVYLATSNDLQGLIAQGRTVTETLEIAHDVARKLSEAQDSVSVQTP